MGLTLLLAIALPTAVGQETVWGPWQHAATMCRKDPSAELFDARALNAGDVIGARFQIDPLVPLEVSAYLGTATTISTDPNDPPPPDPIVVNVELRSVADPSILHDSTTLSLSSDLWGRPYAWHSATLQAPLTGGVCWVCLAPTATVPNGAIQVVTEYDDGLEHELTWDPVTQGYAERDGLWWPIGQAGPTLDSPDPYIRIRQGSGQNHPPVIVGVSVSPKWITPSLSATFTGVATDLDAGDLDVNTVCRLAYTRGDDPTLVPVETVPVITMPEGRLTAVYTLSGLAEGAYRLFFAVQDKSGRWSIDDPNVPQPTLLMVRSEGEDDDCPAVPPPAMGPVTDECGDTLCTFLGLGTGATVVDPDGSPTSIFNRYCVCINVPWSAIAGQTRVLFRLLDEQDNILREHISHEFEAAAGGGERWYATFDTTALPRPAAGQTLDLTIMAIGCLDPNCTGMDMVSSCDDLQMDPNGIPGPYEWETWPCSEATVRVYAPPVWYAQNWVGLQTAVWHEEPHIYQFTGLVPWNPDWIYPTTYFEEPLVFGWPLGTLNNAIGARIDVDERYKTTAVPIRKVADGGIDAWLLGIQLYDKPFDITYKWDRDIYDVTYHSEELLDESMTIVDGWSTNTYYIPPPPSGPVLVIEFVLSVDVGVEAWYELGTELPAELRFPVFCVTPYVEPYMVFDLAADLYWGIGTVGMQVRPSLTLGLPACYNYSAPQGEQFYLGDATAVFAVIARGYGCVRAIVEICYYSGWYELFTYPPPGKEPPHARAAPVAWTEDEAGADNGRSDPNCCPDDPCRFVNPRIASDGEGNAMAVWVHYAEGDATPDIFYSYYDPNAIPPSWTAPAAVWQTELVESDPTLTFLDNGKAMLVVTQNQWTQAQAEGQDPNAIVAQQELMYSTYDPNQVCWSSFQKVRNDGGTPRADGRPELSPGPAAAPFVVWVRDPDGVLPNADPNYPLEGVDSDVMVSRWIPGSSPQWSNMQALESDPNSALLEPDIALDGPDNAMAVWVCDADGNGVTGSDRVIRACYFDGDDWGSPYVAVDASSDTSWNLRGMLWPTVGFDAGSDPVIVFTARTGPDNGGLNPSNNEYGEGTNDFLFAAIRPSFDPNDPNTPVFDPNDPNPALFRRIESIGGPYQHRGRWPRMAVARPPLSPMAFIGARWFRGTGRDGFDGEVAVAMKSLAAPLDLTDCWPSPVRLTEDGELDWQVDLDVDQFAGVLRIVSVKPSTYDPNDNPTLEFDAGFDGIQVAQIQLGPDASVDANDICLCPPYPLPTENMTVKASLRNVGTEDADVIVRFLLDDIEIPTCATPVLLRYQRAATVECTFVADGMPHTLKVMVADPNVPSADTDLTNNEASRPILASPPPARLSIAPDLAAGALVLSWVSPQTVDPAAPPTKHYRVYRDDAPGTPSKTMGTTYSDSGVEYGTDYSYTVTAVTRVGAESPPAGPITAVLTREICRGDCNCDGQIDFGDINSFVDALMVPPVYCDGTGDNADIDGNGSPGFEDINPFVDLLTSYPLPIDCPGPLQ